jgi:hypothetical protein
MSYIAYWVLYLEYKVNGSGWSGMNIQDQKEAETKDKVDSLHVGPDYSLGQIYLL